MFYPGMGYSFASAYPWGWLPYHYGSWAFINGAGWAWLPGRYSGQWVTNAYQIVPRVTKAPTGWTAATPPATAVAATSAPTVVVGKAGTAPLSIPGGRIPPNFASLVPGRAVRQYFVHGFVKPNSDHGCQSRSLREPTIRMSAAHHGSTGHVFAEPSPNVFAGRGDGFLWRWQVDRVQPPLACIVHTSVVACKCLCQRRFWCRAVHTK